jgi:hypothetical protein
MLKRILMGACALSIYGLGLHSDAREDASVPAFVPAFVPMTIRPSKADANDWRPGDYYVTCGIAGPCIKGR